MMGFLVEAFGNLNDLKKFIPEVPPLHPVQKSEIVPMKLLFKDDQLTCKVIRGCKVWRSPEPDPVDKLIWANEIPGML